MNGSRMTQAAVTACSVAPSSAGPSASPWLEIEQPEMRRSGSRLMGSRPSSRQDMPTCSMPPSSGSGKTLLSPVASLPMGSPFRKTVSDSARATLLRRKPLGRCRVIFIHIALVRSRLTQFFVSVCNIKKRAISLECAKT